MNPQRVNRILLPRGTVLLLVAAVWAGNVPRGEAQPPRGNLLAPVVVAPLQGPTPWEDVDFESLYDPERVITVRGPITGIWRFPLGERRTGLVARVHVHGEFVYVYLGSLEYLLHHHFELGISDYVTLQGNRARLRHRGSLVVADSITKASPRPIPILRLRDDRGRPLW